MSRKSWAEEQVKVYADRCWNEDMPLDDGMLALVTKTIRKCAAVASSAFLDMDNDTLPKSACRIAAADILALLEPGDEGETP